MKTRDRIIQASLTLFNERGERNVTTNHIAAYLKISPGNLYYHFRNKSDIIYSLFLSYKAMVDNYLSVPPDRALGMADKMGYLEAVFDGLWYYRFFHRDLEYLLDSDSRLRKDYRLFTLQCLGAIKAILRGLEAGRILQMRSEDEREAMALNTWLVVTNWMAFLKTAHADEEDGADIDRQQLKQGIYQVLTLEMPYVTPAHEEDVRLLREQYRPDPVAMPA
ncbi:MAG: TetR/AcrR family transcriptional regulator [Oleiphilaceae bacterium]|nr:TetR/AcrR family transcriptional regulator [Oleiphilaceae bacterium]